MAKENPQVAADVLFEVKQVKKIVKSSVSSLSDKTLAEISSAAYSILAACAKHQGVRQQKV